MPRPATHTVPLLDWLRLGAGAARSTGSSPHSWSTRPPPGNRASDAHLALRVEGPRRVDGRWDIALRRLVDATARLFAYARVMQAVRPPAVAGTFYPADPVELRSNQVGDLAFYEGVPAAV